MNSSSLEELTLADSWQPSPMWKASIPSLDLSQKAQGYFWPGSGLASELCTKGLCLFTPQESSFL